MTERIWRFLFGFLCILFLTFEFYDAIYTLLALTLFEGITNLRLTLLLSKTNLLQRTSKIMTTENLFIKPENRKNIPFDAQRMHRIIIPLFVGLPLIFYPQLLWFIPWLIGITLTLSGLSGICSMLFFLQWPGFRYVK
jgi:hypothetical protein